jgi:hypothetical protein
LDIGADPLRLAPRQSIVDRKRLFSADPSAPIANLSTGQRWGERMRAHIFTSVQMLNLKLTMRDLFY